MGPCHNDMTSTEVADGGEDLQIWRVAANIFNMQLRQPSRCGPPPCCELDYILMLWTR